MTDSPMYPHLADTATVKNMGYNGHFFVWQHIDGRVCQASTNTAAERQFELHGVMASTPTKTEIDADFAAFCRKVDATDCKSQWADRGGDHD